MYYVSSPVQTSERTHWPVYTVAAVCIHVRKACHAGRERTKERSKPKSRHRPSPSLDMDVRRDISDDVLYHSALRSTLRCTSINSYTVDLMAGQPRYYVPSIYRIIVRYTAGSILCAPAQQTWGLVYIFLRYAVATRQCHIPSTHLACRNY